MNHGKNCLLALALLGLGVGLPACTGSGENDQASTGKTPATTAPANKTTVKGAFMKGPVAGATVRIYDIQTDETPVPVSTASTVTSDSDGNFVAADIPYPAADYYEITTEGGSFIDDSDPIEFPATTTTRRNISLAAGFEYPALFPAGGVNAGPSASGSFISAPITPYSIAMSMVPNARGDIPGHTCMTYMLAEAEQKRFLDTSGIKNIHNTPLDPFSILPVNPIQPNYNDLEDPNRYQYALMIGGFANALNIAAIKLGMPVADETLLKAMLEDLNDGRLDGKRISCPSIEGSECSFVTAMYNSTPLPTDIDLNAQIKRFRNNNADKYSAVPLPQISYTGINYTSFDTYRISLPPVALRDNYTLSSAGGTLVVPAGSLLANDCDAGMANGDISASTVVNSYYFENGESNIATGSTACADGDVDSDTSPSGFEVYSNGGFCFQDAGTCTSSGCQLTFLYRLANNATSKYSEYKQVYVSIPGSGTGSGGIGGGGGITGSGGIIGGAIITGGPDSDNNDIPDTFESGGTGGVTGSNIVRVRSTSCSNANDGSSWASAKCDNTGVGAWLSSLLNIGSQRYFVLYEDAGAYGPLTVPALKLGANSSLTLIGGLDPAETGYATVNGSGSRFSTSASPCSETGPGLDILANDNDINIYGLMFNNMSSATGAGIRTTDLASVTHNLYIYASSINDNCATNDGGGVYLGKGWDADFVYTNFINNHAISDGGAVYIVDGSPSVNTLFITLSELSLNNAQNTGGALRVSDTATAFVSDSLVQSNTVTSTGINCGGGAIYRAATNGSTGLFVTNSNVLGNVANCSQNGVEGGGAVYSGVNGFLGVYNSRFEQNQCKSSVSPTPTDCEGGALAVDLLSSNLVNNLFIKNASATLGGAVSYLGSTGGTSGSSDFLVLNTVADNTSAQGGGIYVNAPRSVSSSNNILFSNKIDAGSTANDLTADVSADFSSSYDMIGSFVGGVTATNLQTSDPLFVDDYYLTQSASSGAFDKGSVTSDQIDCTSGATNGTGGTGGSVVIPCSDYTTSFSGAGDTGQVDIGYHRPIPSSGN